MESKLAKGTTLVIDRYAFSGVAFTSAKVTRVRAFTVLRPIWVADGH
jgi:hypothetical protein